MPDQPNNLQAAVADPNGEPFKTLFNPPLWNIREICSTAADLNTRAETAAPDKAEKAYQPNTV